MIFFESFKIDRNITCIKGVIFGELMYLIEGTERAILIDTGLGVGNIREYIDSLTTLPYIVLHSHVHLDHIGGSFLFNTAYINPKDSYLLNNLDRDVKRRKSFVESTFWGCVQENDYVPVRQIEFLPIEDNELFELGGITVEAILTPGHTKGSLCFLLKEKRILITGDACSNPFTLVFLDESTSIEEYQTSILKLLERAEEYDEVYISHTYYKVPKSIIKDAYECCTDIIDGNTDDVSYKFFGQKDGEEGYFAKKQNSNGEREDGKLANIVYSKKKIYIE